MANGTDSGITRMLTAGMPIGKADDKGRPTIPAWAVGIAVVLYAASQAAPYLYPPPVSGGVQPKAVLENTQSIKSELTRRGPVIDANSRLSEKNADHIRIISDSLIKVTTTLEHVVKQVDEIRKKQGD